jgi:hypothetical protein
MPVQYGATYIPGSIPASSSISRAQCLELVVKVAHDMSGWASTRSVYFLDTAWEPDACLEPDMNCYLMAAMQRTMKIQEAIL